jgi:hypothetical protein
MVKYFDEKFKSLLRIHASLFSRILYPGFFSSAPHKEGGKERGDRAKGARRAAS